MKTLLCLLLGTGLLFGQFEYGEILGTVRDASQGVVSGAKVTLRNLDTNVEREGVTNEDGDYSFPNLRAGHYSVQSERPGFKASTTPNLELRTGDHLRNDVVLETGNVTEQVTRGGDSAAARDRHQRARRSGAGGANRGLALE